MQWAVLDRSVVARYAFALVLGGLAAAAHWAMFPYIGGRVPFLLFLPSIILVTSLAGRGPGLVVTGIGFINAVLQLAPVGALAVAAFADRAVLAAYVVTGGVLVLLGERVRAISRREYEDLRALHDLSAALAQGGERDQQLELILRTLAHMHGTDRGLVSLYDSGANTLCVAASQRFSPAALATLQSVRGGEGSCGLACLEARRVVVEDVDHEPCFAPFRDLAASEGFRAVHSTPILNRDGRVLGVISVHSSRPRRPSNREMHLADICANKAAVVIERAAAEERRRQHEQALREADRRKDEFLATLAHELRNPLAPIRQAAAVANSERTSESQRRWAYAVIERQVANMSLLLEDLLDVSRITRGVLTLRKRSVRLGPVVTAAVETAQPLIDSRQHRLSVDVPAELELVCDPLRLSQVLANLLTNAAKYTPPGGTIELAGRAEEDTLVLSVKDSGTGLRAEDMPRIFEMFSQVRPNAQHTQGGLGIGLALTRGLVEMHGGRIEAHSEGPGQGTTFTVRVPVGDSAAANPGAETDSEIAPVPVRCVLIVDDNEDTADSLAILLRHDGHRVVVAANGESALDLFEQYAPQIVLLDIGMPGMNGYEVARRIRVRPEGREVLLVAVTGFGQERDRRDAEAAGFDHHLVKPVEPEQVRKLVNRTLVSAAVLAYGNG